MAFQAYEAGMIVLAVALYLVILVAFLEPAGSAYCIFYDDGDECCAPNQKCAVPVNATTAPLAASTVPVSAV